jgi:hypothetical protein
VPLLLIAGREKSLKLPELSSALSGFQLNPARCSALVRLRFGRDGGMLC